MHLVVALNRCRCCYDGRSTLRLSETVRTRLRDWPAIEIKAAIMLLRDGRAVVRPQSVKHRAHYRCETWRPPATKGGIGRDRASQSTNQIHELSKRVYMNRSSRIDTPDVDSKKPPKELSIC